MNYAQRLHAAIRAKNSPLVVGLDPRLDRVPTEIRTAARDARGDDPAWITDALTTFCTGIIDAIEPFAPAVKPNIAFFERYHLPGLVAYANTVAAARARGLLVIGDVKRSDIGSTAEAYAEGHLGDALPELTDGRLTVDAVTLNPLLGTDSIRPFLDACRTRGAGLYILVRTSNPSATELQSLDTGGRTISQRIAELVEAWGAEAGIADGYSPVGAVVGATAPAELRALRSALPHASLLVPGYGAQGGTADDVAPAFDDDGVGAVINASRSICFAFEKRPDVPWRTAVADAARAAAEELDRVRRGR